MRKFVLFALFVSLLCAESELKQPLSAKSTPQKALTNSQESTLQKENLQENALQQNEQKAVNSAQNSLLAEDDEPNIYDFAKIAAREYSGEDTTINILRIKTHDTNYFCPLLTPFTDAQMTQNTSKRRRNFSSA